MRKIALRVTPTFIAMLLVLIGMQTFIIQPGIVQGFVTGLGLTAAHAGYLAAAETSGIAVATIACAIVGNALSWRAMCAFGLAILAGCDLASAFVAQYPALLALRFAAGLAEGVLISLGYAAVGRASNPDRAFGYLITIVLTYGALGLLGIPAAIAHGGMKSIMLTLASMALLGLAAVRWFPEPGRTAARSPASPSGLGLRRRELAMLLAVLAFFLGQGVIWAYLFLIGTRMGLGSQAVANALTIAQFAGIAGALSAATICLKLPRLLTLALGTVCILVGLLLFSYRLGALGFSLAAVAFNWAANLLTPFLIALVADLNQRLVQTAAALQMTGLALGPALAALSVTSGHYTTILLVSAALAALTLLFGGYAHGRAAMIH